MALRQSALARGLIATIAMSAGAAAAQAEEAEAAPAPIDYAEGSFLAKRLREDDRAALAEAFQAAMAAPQYRASAQWTGPRASGSVEARGAAVRAPAGGVQVERAAPLGIDVSAPLYLQAWAGVTVMAADVRLAPALDAAAATRLPAEADVDVLGAVNDGAWLLVGLGDEVLGFMAADAVAALEPDAIGPLGERTVTLEYCRAFTQRLTVRRKMDLWLGLACRDAEGAWRLAEGEEA